MSTRQNLIDKLAKGTWDGTEALLDAVVTDSQHTFGWRPVRVAALLAIRDIEHVGPAMTAEAFEDWFTKASAFTKGGGPMVKTLLGASPYEIRKWRKEGAPKVVALACAHVMAGLEPPVEPVAADLDAWFRPRFGGAQRIAIWLGMAEESLACRLRGWSSDGGKRRDRQPELYLVRALDWLWKVGPVSPYTRYEPAQVWPEQEPLP